MVQFGQFTAFTPHANFAMGDTLANCRLNLVLVSGTNYYLQKAPSSSATNFYIYGVSATDPTAAPSVAYTSAATYRSDRVVASACRNFGGYFYAVSIYTDSSTTKWYLYTFRTTAGANVETNTELGSGAGVAYLGDVFYWNLTPYVMYSVSTSLKIRNLDTGTTHSGDFTLYDATVLCGGIPKATSFVFPIQDDSGDGYLCSYAGADAFTEGVADANLDFAVNPLAKESQYWETDYGEFLFGANGILMTPITGEDPITVTTAPVVSIVYYNDLSQNRPEYILTHEGSYLCIYKFDGRQLLLFEKLAWTEPDRWAGYDGILYYYTTAWVGLQYTATNTINGVEVGVIEDKIVYPEMDVPTAVLKIAATSNPFTGLAAVFLHDNDDALIYTGIPQKPTYEPGIITIPIQHFSSLDLDREIVTTTTTLSGAKCSTTINTLIGSGFCAYLYGGTISTADAALTTNHNWTGLSLKAALNEMSILTGFKWYLHDLAVYWDAGTTDSGSDLEAGTETVVWTKQITYPTISYITLIQGSYSASDLVTETLSPYLIQSYVKSPMATAGVDAMLTALLTSYDVPYVEYEVTAVKVGMLYPGQTVSFIGTTPFTSVSGEYLVVKTEYSARTTIGTYTLTPYVRPPLFSDPVKALETQIATLSTNTDAQLMIGAGNAATWPCLFEIANVVGKVVGVAGGAVANVDGTDFTAQWGCSLPTHRGSLTLYIKNVYVYLADADANNYITAIAVDGIEADGTINVLQYSATDRNSVGLHTMSHSAVSAGDNEKIFVYLACVCDTAEALEINYVKLEVYYDA